ncbi:MAG: hypothetical protein KGI49_03485 [Patescibacteria group bacterium]|nr:hypothetical protein [Patescibacteria group bacterium]
MSPERTQHMDRTNRERIKEHKKDCSEMIEAIEAVGGVKGDRLKQIFSRILDHERLMAIEDCAYVKFTGENAGRLQNGYYAFMEFASQMLVELNRGGLRKEFMVHAKTFKRMIREFEAPPYSLKDARADLQREFPNIS